MRQLLCIALIGIVLIGDYVVTSTKDCEPCPSSCPYGNTFTKRKDICICNCAENPCNRKKCQSQQQCRVEDREICRGGNCIKVKVGACYKPDESPKLQEHLLVLTENSPPRPDFEAKQENGDIQGQLRIVPSRIELHEGDSTELKCELHDSTETKTTRQFKAEWSQQYEKSLPSNFKVLPGNVLRIEKARESNSGTYRCTATSRHEVIHEDVQVRVLPRIREHIFNDFEVVLSVAEPSTRMISIGSKVVVECVGREAGNDLVKEVTWSKIEGVGSDRSIKTTTRRDNSILTIKNFLSADLGKYECTAVSLDDQISRNSIEFTRDSNNPRVINYRIEKSITTTTTTATTTTTTESPGRERETMILLRNRRPLTNSDSQANDNQQFLPDFEVFDGNNQPFTFTKDLPEFPDSSVVTEMELIGPREIKVNEGGSVVVEFRVYNGAGRLTIGKYDDDLPAGSRVEVRDDVVYKLYLNNMRREDKGYYTCMVTSKYGQTVRKAIMIYVGKCRPNKVVETTATPDYRPVTFVRGQPFKVNIVKTSDVIDVNEGDSLSIECNVAAFSRSYFNKLDDRMSMENLVRRDGNSIYLEFTSIRQRDAGTYECLGDNDEYGSSTDTIEVRVKAREEDPRVPRAKVLKTDDIRKLNEGDSTVIECEVERSIDVELTKAGNIMPENFRRVTENNIYKLNLYNLKSSDSGYYFCIAKNEYGNDRCWIYLDIRPISNDRRIEDEIEEENRLPETSVTTTTTASEQNNGGSLYVRINGSVERTSNDFLEVNLFEGEEMILDCEVKNGQIESLKKHSGTPQNMISKQLSEQHHQLIISDLSLDDSGYYSCNAYNDSQNDRDLVILTVQSRDQ